MTDLPRLSVPSVAKAVFKQSADDFIVTEIIDVAPTGAGEHFWLYIKKRNINTQYVIELLATWANIPAKDIGYSGLKDKKSISYQWLSLRIPKGQLPDMVLADFINGKLKSDESIELLQCHQHNKKLNRGTHKSNHFNITLRQVVADKTAVEHQLGYIAKMGVPNYFGQQRFGMDGDNLAKAEQLFARLLANDKPYRPHKKNRAKHSLYISAAKSALFNELLARRIQAGTYERTVLGDVYNLNGSGSIFTSDIDDTLQARLDGHDIHIAGLMYGAGERRSGRQAREYEDAVLADHPQYRAGLDKVGTAASYRPLRLLVQDLRWVWHDDGALQLDFRLTAGSFATSVLSALVADLAEG